MHSTHEVPAAAGRLVGGWSEVRAADHVTRYMRLGGGSESPVVILVSSSETTNIWPELYESLAAGRRVYIPDLPDDATFSQRLSAFLDGLGLGTATLVAPGGFCGPALEFALLSPDRLRDLVLVPAGSAEETGLTGTLNSAQPKREIPVLLVRRDTLAADAVELVSAFVARA